MAKQPRAAKKRGHKLVADFQRQRWEVSDLTVDEAAAMTADITARVAALRQRWEASGDLQALFGALIFYQSRLPQWLAIRFLAHCWQPKPVRKKSETAKRCQTGRGLD